MISLQTGLRALQGLARQGNLTASPAGAAASSLRRAFGTEGAEDDDKKKKRNVLTVLMVAERMSAASGGKLKKTELRAILETAVDHMVEHLKQGGSVRFNGIGSVNVKAVPARNRYSVQEEKVVHEGARTSVYFRTAPSLKDALNPKSG